jgi:transposase InsO family protein
MKMAAIAQLAGEHSVRKLCRTLGIARSAYYATDKKRHRLRAREDVRLGVKIAALFEQSHRTYGSPRLVMALRRAGERCGRRRVARLMRGRGLRARQQRRFRPRTTDSHHLCPIAPNRLAARTAPPSHPDEVWAADITYVPTGEGWLYVAGVLDLYSRRLVGWAAEDAMPTALVVRAFERALTQRRPPAGLLHHSDRGSQYASDAYHALLHVHGVETSMSRAGNCYDNAHMESFWATLKTELIQGRTFRTHAEARSALFDYIEIFYNRARLHGALGFQSPVEYEHNPG